MSRLLKLLKAVEFCLQVTAGIMVAIITYLIAFFILLIFTRIYLYGTV